MDIKEFRGLLDGDSKITLSIKSMSFPDWESNTLTFGTGSDFLKIDSSVIDVNKSSLGLSFNEPGRMGMSLFTSAMMIQNIEHQSDSTYLFTLKNTDGDGEMEIEMVVSNPKLDD